MTIGILLDRQLNILAMTMGPRGQAKPLTAAISVSLRSLEQCLPDASSSLGREG